MDIHTFENEALKTLTLHTAQFPHANNCIASQSRLRNASVQSLNTTGQMKTFSANPQEPGRREENAVLEVIWAGRHDEQNNRVICQLASKNGSILNSYYAKVMGPNGDVIARECFVSFAQDIAFASMIVPRKIFDQCSIQMDIAMIGREVRTASQTISLNQFNVQGVKAVFQVKAPRITRAGSHDMLRISYYHGSSTESYDYVYDGTSTDQMYFPSEGEITIDGIELQGADGQLTISNGNRKVTCYEPKVMSAEDSVIYYSFNERWAGTNLSDCFNKNEGIYTKADYLLRIKAVDRNKKSITLMITNIASLIGQGDGDEEGVKSIPEIEVYLDCFAAGTPIRMADGSAKTVENIRKGDLVCTADGTHVPVREVMSGDDCQVLTLTFGSGRTLSVTGGHAIDTKDGAFPASRLKEGQEVLTEEGTDKIVQITPHCEVLYTVYALFLEGDAEWLYASGVKVHSSDCGDVFKDRDWVREDLPEEWRADYDNALAAGMIYGRR